MLKINKPIVSVNWLSNNLKASNLIVLDATISKVTNTNSVNKKQIPNALFFDIKNKFSDVSGAFPNTFPSEKQFTLEAQNLSVNYNSAIVVYDDLGIYSSARAWWLFKAFGFTNVAVLNGGLLEWVKQGFNTEIKKDSERKKGNFVAKYQPNLMQFFDGIQNIVSNKTATIIDARSKARFLCEIPEPRKGLRSGTIPNSKNLPFKELLVEENLRPKEELQAIFSKLVATNKVVFSCGSGITACILALGAEMAGYNNISVYDGSWTEYGSLIKT